MQDGWISHAKSEVAKMLKRPPMGLGLLSPGILILVRYCFRAEIVLIQVILGHGIAVPAVGL